MGNTNQYGYGSRGSGVSNLQKLLNKAGFNLTVDGIFGNQTLSAVKKYQKDNGLDVDGIAGKNTLASLEGTGSAKASNTAPTNTAPKTTNKTTGFTYDPYTESDVVKEAKAAYDAHMSQKPGQTAFTWQDQLNDNIKKILNREDFSYDFNQDALYQQYKDKYIQQGKMAMADTMGQASAMTGGYGNSYAQSVGQQAYNAHLEQLNDIIPELYQMAYDKYNREGEELYNQYSMLSDREAFEYGQYRDKVADWQSDRDFLANRLDSERNFDYGKHIDDRDLAYTDHSNAIENEHWQKAYDYQVERDKVADAQWDKEFGLAQGKFDYEVAQDSLEAEDTQKTYTGTKPNGGGNYNNGGLTMSQIKELQNALGVSVDGYYGEESKGKADGLSAKEAYEKFVGPLDGGSPEAEYQRIALEVAEYQRNGAPASMISAYIRSEFEDGKITQSGYDALKARFLGGGGNGGHYTH